MGATLNEQTQYFDSAGDPLVGGKVYIGDQNSDPVASPKDIFSDRELTIALANPQTLDSLGRTANKIWTEGNYSIRVDDVDDVQIYQELDNGTAQDGTVLSLTGITGADTITATAVTTITAYVDKKIYFFYPALDNTGAVTLNIDGVGAKAIVKKYAQPLDAGDMQATEAVIISYNSANDNFDWLNQAGTNAGGIVDAESIGIVPNDTTPGVQTANVTAINTALGVDGNNIIFGGGTFSFNGTWDMEKSVMVCGLGQGATVWNFTDTTVDAIENHGDDGSDKRKQSILCNALMTMTGTQDAGKAAVLSRAPLFMHDMEVGVKGGVAGKFSIGARLDGVSVFESAAENKFQNVNWTTSSSHGVEVDGNVVGAEPRRCSFIACRTELNGGRGMYVHGALSAPKTINVKDVIFSTNDGVGLDLERSIFSHMTGIDAFSNDTGGADDDVKVGVGAVNTCRLEIAGLTTDAATNLDVTLANLTSTPVWFGSVNYGTALPAGLRGVLLRKNTTQALTAAGGLTLLTFQVEEYDTDGFVDLGVSDTDITIPSGKGFTHAIVGAQVARDDATGQFITQILLNGVATALTPDQHSETTATDRNNMASLPIPISDGDIFTIKAEVGADSDITALTSFGLYIIGQT